jgi:hypothetical protein
VAAAGDVHTVVSEYESYLVTRGKRVVTGWAESRRETGEIVPGGLRLEGIDLFDDDGRTVQQLAPGARFVVRFRIGGAGGPLPCHVGVAFDTQDGRCAFATTTQVDGVPAGPDRPRRACASRSTSCRSPGAVCGGRLPFDETGLQLYDQVIVARPVPVA